MEMARFICFSIFTISLGVFSNIIFFTFSWGSFFEILDYQFNIYTPVVLFGSPVRSIYPGLQVGGALFYLGCLL